MKQLMSKYAEKFCRRKWLAEAAKWLVEAVDAEAASHFWKRKRLAFCRFRNPVHCEYQLYLGLICVL